MADVQEHERVRRTGRILLVMWMIVLLLIAFFVITPYLVSFFMSSRALMSLDWAGYAVVSDFRNPQPVFVSVNGSWIVPRVSMSQRDTFSATWIGIGGQLDDTLIQVGTEQDYTSGAESYCAWYELLPNDSVTIDTISISPGDKITASVSLVDSGLNGWSIEIYNAVKNQKFKQNFMYDSSMLSAEWIIERPTVDHSISTLANFGSIAFTNSEARTNMTVGTINSFPFSRMTMWDRRNRPLVTVSSLGSNGSDFTITYLIGGTAT